MIKIWYVMEASMLTSQSEVNHFLKEEDARKHFDERVDGLKSTVMAGDYASWDEFIKDNKDHDTDIEDDNAWFSGNYFNDGSNADVYLEIGCHVMMQSSQEIKVEVKGGMVQEISGIPEGIEVHVTDYDNDSNGNTDVWEYKEKKPEEKFHHVCMRCQKTVSKVNKDGECEECVKEQEE